MKFHSYSKGSWVRILFIDLFASQQPSMPLLGCSNTSFCEPTVKIQQSKILCDKIPGYDLIFFVAQSWHWNKVTIREFIASGLWLKKQNINA